MDYITNFFNNEHNFWNKGTIVCTIILLLLFILDFFTTFKITTMGGTEFNTFMRPLITSPILFGLIKIISVIAIIYIIKIMYDTLQNKFHSKYNLLYVYYTFAVPAGATLFIVIHNLMVLLYI